jgi:hypothetical protein
VRQEVQNRVLMLKEPVTAEVSASSTDRRKWLLVLPEEAGVALIEFEHAADADTDGWFAPEDVLDRVKTHYDNLDALLAALSARGVDSELFDAPWKMDYPL